MVMSTLATVVMVRASMKAVNITDQHTPDSHKDTPPWRMPLNTPRPWVRGNNIKSDKTVKRLRQKQLTNFRVSGKEDAIKITPPIELTLEYAVEFIEDDELVEITPKSVRLRKRHLKEHERKRASREG